MFAGATGSARREEGGLTRSRGAADGVRDPEADALIRKLGGLICVTDRERMPAKKRVPERMGRPKQ